MTAPRAKGAGRLRDSLAAADLAGKLLLIVGLGRIGREVAVRARAFGMRIAAYDPVLAAPPDGIEATLVADLDQAVGEADAISLHVPLSEQTRNLFSRERIARMKKQRRAGVRGARRPDRRAGPRGCAEGGTHPRRGPRCLRRGAAARRSSAAGARQRRPFPALGRTDRECAERMASISAQNCLDGLDGRLKPELIVNPEVLGGRQ